MLKFTYHNWRERKSQEFDKEKITLTKAGKTFNVYDRIQENREDTEIYPTLEKYGCIDKLMLDTKGVYADFTQYNELRDLKEQQAKAKEMFYNLPLETRQHFNNDMNEFAKNGEKWLKNKIDEEIKLQQKQKEINQTTNSTNETKVEKGESNG